MGAISKDTLKESAYLGALRNMDALAHVVRVFRDDSVAHIKGSIDPPRDIASVELDLILADLGIVENRLERLEKDRKKIKNLELEREQILLQKARQWLEAEKPLREADWNQEEKKRMGVGYISGVSVTVAIISDILLYVGFIVTAIFLLAKPTTWGFIFLGIYAIVFFFRALGIKPRAYGRIHQDSNNSSLAYAIIRVFSTQLRREVAHAVLDIRGRYFCLVPKGEYYLVIERKISDEQYQPIFTSDSIFASNGIINKSFDLSFIS